MADTQVMDTELAKGEEPRIISGGRHGTQYMYKKKGCRCGECTAWYTASRAKPDSKPRPGLLSGLRGKPDEDGEKQDPPPAYMRGPQRRPLKVTAKTRDDIGASVGMLAVPIMAAMAKDPYCGAVLAAQLEPITDAVVPLLCKSAAVVAFFTDKGSDWLLWWNLATALSPVAVAVGRHHILRTVELAEETDADGKPTGNIIAVERDLAEYTT
jgi:hypothetical protein